MKELGSRRSFLKSAIAGATGLGMVQSSSVTEAATSQQIPIKIAHRAANMKMIGNVEVFKVASQIPGLKGIELQVTAGVPNLWDLDAVRRYKREAHRWGISIPSVAGIWAPGVSILHSPSAGINVIKAIRAAELLGASVILVAFFAQNAPDMSKEGSYAPAVRLLQDSSVYAADAGIVLGLESSLSPADHSKLVDIVDRPNVKVYFDLYNTEDYGHKGQAVAGIKLLGRDRICQVHVKNQARLIEEPGKVDWQAAFQAFGEIGYEGWFVLESEHSDESQCIESTTRNIEFMRTHIRMGSD
ncbi:MAG: sugar phosphate isomerase/epimerase family protein [Acidobacteriota bacterium]